MEPGTAEAGQGATFIQDHTDGDNCASCTWETADRSSCGPVCLRLYDFHPGFEINRLSLYYHSVCCSTTWIYWIWRYAIISSLSPKSRHSFHVHPTFSNLELDDGVLQYADLLVQVPGKYQVPTPRRVMMGLLSSIQEPVVNTW